MALRPQPPVSINPNVPIEIQRELRKVMSVASEAQASAAAAHESLATKVNKNEADLTQVSQFVSKQISAGGSSPLSLTGLIGKASESQLAYAPALATAPVAPNPLARAGQLYQLGGKLYINNTPVSLGGAGGSTLVGPTAQFLEGTHATRLALSVPANGTAFWETDRNIIYIGVAGAWTYAVGVMIATTGSRPSDLGATDAGFLFLASDTLIWYYWTGAAWDSVTPPMGGASYPTNDVTGTFPNPALTATGVSAASYGDDTHVGQFTVDAAGRISTAAPVAITFPAPPSGVSVTVVGVFTIGGVSKTNLVFTNGILASYS
jgi:hypothetical protein